MYCTCFTHIVVILCHVFHKYISQPIVSKLESYGISLCVICMAMAEKTENPGYRDIFVRKKWPTIHVQLQVWKVTPFQLSSAFPPSVCLYRCTRDVCVTATVWQSTDPLPLFGTLALLRLSSAERPSNKQPSVPGKKPYFVLMVLNSAWALSLNIHTFLKLQYEHVCPYILDWINCM